MATKTSTRSPLQPLPSTSPSRGLLYYTHLDNAAEHQVAGFIEYISADASIAVVGKHYGSGYLVVVKDPTVTPSKEYQDYAAKYPSWTTTVDRGVYRDIQVSATSKTAARTLAEGVLVKIQDTDNPLAVSLDGQHGPAFDIATQTQAGKDQFWRDRDIQSTYASIAVAAGVHPVLLALAIKENRLTWSTPKVAPARFLVVVEENATANLVERLVDEVQYSTSAVEDGQILAKGTISEYLLVKRYRRQVASIRHILDARDALQRALQEVQSTSGAHLESLAQGRGLVGGLRDDLSLGRLVEQANVAAATYRQVLVSNDLPEAFLERLTTGEFTEDTGSRHSDDYAARRAFAALTGQPFES